MPKFACHSFLTVICFLKVGKKKPMATSPSKVKDPRGRKPNAPHEKVRKYCAAMATQGYKWSKVRAMAGKKFGYHPVSIKKIIGEKEALKLHSQL